MRSPTILLSPNQVQGRLLILASAFLGVYALALTLSPAARLRSWDVEYRWTHWLGFLIWLVLVFIAHRQSNRYLPGRDPYLLPVAALLSGWGLLTIWRLFPGFGLRQTIWLFVVLLVFTLGLRLPSNLSFLRRYKYVWLFAGLSLTALTLLLGTNPASGSSPRLWLGCCGVYFQPSEPLKLLLIVYLAAYLADRLPHLNLGLMASNAGLETPIFSIPSWVSSLRALLPLLFPTLLMTGLTLALLLAQRDLGTASIFILIYAVVLYLATGRGIIVIVSTVTLVSAAAAGYILFDVVQVRINAWLNPWLDPSGHSYQIVQSLLAVANGGLFGRGPGLGNPVLVPVSHSDFIFAAIVEESGLLGVIGLIILLALLTASGLRVALRASNQYLRYLAAGLTTYLVAQSVLIAGGNLRLLPLTGVTLPFVSYGGSSLLTAFLSLLLLLHVSQRSEEHPEFTPNPRPYLYLGGFLLLSLTAVAVVAGWWAYYRGPRLLERTDNPRRAIADRYVRRGTLLDRHNQPLALTEGTPGELLRDYLYPSLSSTLGYIHPVYGQSGLEDSLDPYLRGLRGNPALSIWWNHILYGQPPPGLDVRLSLDLDLQRRADELLGEHPGALVLLNAESGEILALASHPTFDPNRLDETWEQLVADPQSPLFNRATLGRYFPGSSLAPFFLAAVSSEGDVPSLPPVLDLNEGNLQLDCAQVVSSSTWPAVVAAGCPAAQYALGRALGEETVLDLYKNLGLYTTPSLQLPAESPPVPQSFRFPQRALLGLSEVEVSPLQMALAAATLSAGGRLPPPQIATALNTPQTGWEFLPPLGEPTQVFSASEAAQMAESLAVQGLPIWQSLAITPEKQDKEVTWYLAGTLPTRPGAPLALAILLEEGDPALAEKIGQAMINAALNAK